MSSGHSGLLQRKCACGRSASLSGECDACRGKQVPGLQTKLQMSGPADALEREADEVAERVTGSPSWRGAGEDHASLHRPLVQRRTSQAVSGSAEVPSIVDDVLRSPGQPLDRSTRTFFEGRFGHDFGRVRVHHDARAAESANSVNAWAYTVGHHIVFGAQQFAPGMVAGRKLLAHELAHTIQQRGGSAATPHLARQTKPAQPTTGEEMEILEAPKTSDSSEQPWFVFHDAALKKDRRALLPKGARVEAIGAGVTDVRAGPGGKTQRIVLRRVRVLTMPGKGGDPDGVIGKLGMVQARFMAPVAGKAATKPAAKATAPKRYGAKDFDAKRLAVLKTLAEQTARQEAQAAQQRMAANVGLMQVSRGVFGNVGGGGALQVTIQAMAEPVKDELLAVHAALEKLSKQIESHPLYTFFSGLVDGIRDNLAVDVFEKNAETFAKLAVYWSLRPDLQLAFLQGTAIGVKKEIEGLIDLVKDFDQVVDQVISLAKAIASEGGAEITRTLGYQVGSEWAKRMTEIGGMTDLEKLSKALGETFGPMLLEIGIGFASLGSSAAASVSARMASILAKFPKLAAFIDKVKSVRKLLPGGKKKLPDLPKGKGLPDAPDLPRKGAGTAGDVGKPRASADAKPAPPRSAPTKRLPDAQAMELKDLSKDGKNIKRVTDQKLLDDGYDIEIAGREHTYRRRSDGTWCRFSTKDCGYGLDPEDEAAIRKAAEREMAVAAGWAIEDYVGGLGYTRPKAFNFEGIDGWKGGKVRGNVVADADVIQVKGISSMKHDNLINHYNNAVEKLLADSWSDGTKRVTNPKSRTLHLIFEQDKYTNLSLRQQEELLAQMRKLTGLKQNPPITVRWYYFSMGRKFAINL